MRKSTDYEATLQTTLKNGEVAAEYLKDALDDDDPQGVFRRDRRIDRAVTQQT
ncbi:MAG: hypothetical protein HY804_08985 [Nitrospinae bacterium]|nr:hypothetical protein [Nitrospinota bacterium]